MSHMSKYLAPLALATSAFAATTSQGATPLTLDVYTASGAGFHATSTLISGAKDAVLVDAQFTRSDAHRLAARILESGKTLTTIFITHAHPDHYFGLEVLTQQFPRAKVVAKPDVVAAIKTLGPKKLAEWKPLYGSNLADKFIVPSELDGDVIELEGQRLELLSLAAGESEVATAVFVPSAKALIAGDLAFDQIHLWLAEGRGAAWIKSLETVNQQLKPTRVIAGHRNPALAEDAPTADLLVRNVAYIRAFEDALAQGLRADQIVAAMQKRYPAYQLPIIAEIAAKTLAK